MAMPAIDMAEPISPAVTVSKRPCPRNAASRLPDAGSWHGIPGVWLPGWAPRGKIEVEGKSLVMAFAESAGSATLAARPPVRRQREERHEPFAIQASHLSRPHHGRS